MDKSGFSAREDILFRGVTNLNLDAKGRMAIPAKYRERLGVSCGGHLIVTLDRDGCLLLYPLPEWQRIEVELMKLPSLHKQVRGLQRLLLGHATECELDGQGRVLLPSPLRVAAGLNKHAVLVGQGNKFELWDEAKWSEQRDVWLQEEQAAKELVEALEDLAI